MKITVTRGLAELKTLGNRISTAIQTGTYVGVVRGVNETPLVGAQPKAEVEKAIQASFQQVDALIKRRDEIKRAIIVSNAKTRVRISGVEMSVAEAIERKASIEYTNMFISQLQNAYHTASTQVNVQNQRVEADIEKRQLAVYGSDKTKISAEQAEMIANAVKKESEAKLLDPAKIADKIVALRDEYQNFVTEVDFVLSESNARTEIEISD